MNGKQKQVLHAYVYENLPEEKHRRVRRWLMTITNPEVLQTYEALVMQRRRREERLKYWMAHPILARLQRVWKTKLRHLWSGTNFKLNSPAGDLALAGGRLGARPEQEDSRMVLEAPLDQSLELTLKLEEPSYVAVFAIVDGEEFHELWSSKTSKCETGTLEIQQVTLTSESDRIEFIGLLDPSSPVPQPESDDGVDWFFDLLEGWSNSEDGRSVIRASLAPTVGDTPSFYD